MHTTPLRIAAIQPICRPGPVADNRHHFQAHIYEAAARGVKLALLPERFPKGFDLLLMPMRVPTPPRSIFYDERRIVAYHDLFREGATRWRDSWVCR